jgi:hypothetical protein
VKVRFDGFIENKFKAEISGSFGSAPCVVIEMVRVVPARQLSPASMLS